MVRIYNAILGFVWDYPFHWGLISILVTNASCDYIYMSTLFLTLLLYRPTAKMFLERSLPKSTQPITLSQETTWSDLFWSKLHKCTNLASWLTLARMLRPQFDIFKQTTLASSVCCGVTFFLRRLWTWQCPLNQFDRNIYSSFHWVGNTLL